MSANCGDAPPWGAPASSASTNRNSNESDMRPSLSVPQSRARGRHQSSQPFFAAGGRRLPATCSISFRVAGPPPYFAARPGSPSRAALLSRARRNSSLLDWPIAAFFRRVSSAALNFFGIGQSPRVGASDGPRRGLLRRQHAPEFLDPLLMAPVLGLDLLQHPGARRRQPAAAV